MEEGVCVEAFLDIEDPFIRTTREFITRGTAISTLRTELQAVKDGVSDY